MAMNPMLMHAIATIHLGLYKLTGGTLGANLGGRPMLLLTSTGRKSGKKRATPLQYLRDGENMVVVASNGGNKNHPAWLYNIQANPDATAQTGKKVRKVRAVTANEEERARLWPLLLEAYQGYQDYEDETERTIQVVVLTPQE